VTVAAGRRRILAVTAVLAAVAVLAGIALLGDQRRPSLATATPPGRAPLVDPQELVSGGPPPDGIPPLDRPRFQAAGTVDWLAAAEPVAVVELAGDARAYPLQILVWHEIVNDTVGGVPVAVTYCPLCNTAVSFQRPVVDGAATSFGTSGKLYHSNLVMYDRATGSLWPQALGQAVTGELTGQRLARVATQLVAWRDSAPPSPAAGCCRAPPASSGPTGRTPTRCTTATAASRCCSTASLMGACRRWRACWA